MKYCIDCAYIYRMSSTQNYPECLRWQTVETRENPVLGVSVVRNRSFCEHERKADGRCGPEAKGFMERPQVIEFQPKKKRWFKWVA